MQIIIAALAFVAVAQDALATPPAFDPSCKVTQRSNKVDNVPCVPWTDDQGTTWTTCIPFETLMPLNPPSSTSGKQWCPTSLNFDLATSENWGVCSNLKPVCLTIAATESPAAKTKKPTAAPTDKTKKPTKVPTNKPTKKPTKGPTCGGTGNKSCAPTVAPADSESPTASGATDSPTLGEYETGAPVVSSSPTPSTDAPSVATVAPSVVTVAPTQAPVPPTTPTAPVVSSQPSASPTGTFTPTTNATTQSPFSVVPGTGAPTFAPTGAGSIASVASAVFALVAVALMQIVM